MADFGKREKRYFAGANTTEGFVSYYGDIFGACSFVYVIKGGSGTGKSRFMKEVAKAAEENGHEVEYFYCSFDPSSLDGIIIDGKLAMIDGTAPHVYEPSLPGVREEILDLGRFWDRNKLKTSEKEIIALMRDKRRCFDMAYSYLSAVGSLDKARSDLIQKYIRKDKIEAEASSFVSKLKPCASTEKSIRIISAAGRDGRVRFDTYEKIAKKKTVLPDFFGIGHIYLEALMNEADRFGASFAVSYDPFFKNRPDALLLGGDFEVLLTDNERCDGFLSNFAEGVSPEEMKEAKELKSTSQKLKIEAVQWFKKASEIHFEIEKIYVSAMDFDKKEGFTQEFISGLSF